MPSTSLKRWQTDRMPSLVEFDRQCGVVLTSALPNLVLANENLRAYAVLLSAHFQGFCRDLYGEAAQIVVARVRPSLQGLIQAQFSAHRKLNRGNPSLENLRADFERFGFKLDLPSEDSANIVRLAHLAALNEWRNIAAHQGTPTASSGSLTLPLLQVWRKSCDELADSLDRILYNQLRRILKRRPW